VSVDASRRFKRTHPCPICRGGDDLPRGKGRRCSGYLSSDNRFAFCTREEHAGRLEAQPTDPPTFRHLLEGDCHCGIVHAPARTTGTTRTVTFEYQDEHGEPLYRTVRLDGPDGKRIWQERRENGGWEKRLGDTRRVLYRLPELAGAAVVHVAEGEPCADALAHLGFVATTSPMGAGKWRPEYADQLARARRVIVWADADEPGRQHARTIADSLAGRVDEVRIVELDRDRQDGYDVADLIYTASRNGHADDVRGYIEQIAEQTPLYQVRPTRDAPGTHPEIRPAADVESAGASLRPDVVGTQDGTHPLQPPPVIDENRSLVVVGAAAFAAVEEASAEPLLGDDDSTILAAGGSAVWYGDGGAGKTTLGLDQALHLCEGRDWLGIQVARPCRVLWVEDEGPRGKFREKLRRKLTAWDGPDAEARLFVLEAPWSQFTFANEAHRRELVELVREHEIDVVFAGPVQRLGVEGGGTPAEIQAFVDLLELVRADLGRPLAYELIHHENKAGGIAGAWEGATDTLAHVQARGNGHTAIVWDKARWASELHGRTWKLNWRDGEAFEVDDTPETTDEAIADQLLGLVRESPGKSWNGYDELLQGKGARKRVVRDQLLEDGRLVNLGTGKAMKLYLAEQVDTQEAIA
jgi:hypothetical protein